MNLYAFESRNVRDERGRVSTLGDAWLLFLEKGPATAFSSDGCLPRVARSIDPGVVDDPLLTIAAMGPTSLWGIFFHLLGGLHCQRGAAFLRLHRGLPLSALGVLRVDSAGNRRLSLGSFGLAYRQLLYDLLRTSGYSYSLRDCVWAHAVGKHFRTVSVGLSLFEHERSESFCSRLCVRDCVGLWHDVLK